MKVIYFTAGPVPTTNEKADIAALNAFAVAPFDIAVRNALQVGASGAEQEDADYVAVVSGGTIPEAYDDDEVYPVFDPANPPAGGLPATSAVVSHGGVIPVKNSAESVTEDGTLTVELGQVVEAKLAATFAIVETGLVFDGVTGAGANTRLTLTVAAGVISAAVCSAP
jgi:hypothetical protein